MGKPALDQDTEGAAYKINRKDAQQANADAKRETKSDADSVGRRQLRTKNWQLTTGLA